MTYVSKADLVREICQATDIPAEQVKQVVEQLLSHTLAHALEGKQVRLAGFGVFKSQYRKPRVNAFNPDMMTRGQTRVTFTPYESTIERE